MPVSRFRVASDIEYEDFRSDFTYDGNPLVYHIPTLRVPRGSRYSFMEDVIGNKGGFNPVHHVTMRGSLSFPLEDLRDIHGWLIHFNVEPVMIDISKLREYGMIPDPSAVHVAEWAYEAYTAFQAQIPTTVSLANFLYELKDIKGLIPKFERSITRTASSNFLGYQFGVKPFIGDIQKIWAMSEAITKRIKFLRDNRNKPVKLHFSRNIPAMGDSWEIDLPYIGSVEGPTYRVKRASYLGTFRITGELLQDLDIPDTRIGTAKAFAAAAGFNNPAAIVWEAIPYSFVVDWFFHVSSLIDTLSIQPFGGEWKVSKVGYSVSDEFRYLVYLNANSTLRYVGTLSVERFVRKPGFPMSSLLLTDGSLSPTQQVLALALLEQRR